MDSCVEEDPPYSIPLVKPDGTYNNPFRTWKSLPGFRDLLKFLTSTDASGIPSSAADLNSTLPVVNPDLAALQQPPTDGIRVTWIGHASTLVQFEGISLLTDPVFSERCSPIRFAGPKRYRPTPLSVDDLPVIDAVVISHNHYDHLDYASVNHLNRRFGERLRWFVPKGLKQWFLSSGCTNVCELSWWEERHLCEDGSVPSAHVRFCCVPAQHWSRRTLCDTFKSLWCGWAVIGRENRFYFAGDTGYCEAFEQIGRRYGPFDLAAIPIGAYCPREFMRQQHIDPEEAVLIHRDVKARRSIGIHWGTFKLSNEPYMEPPKLVEKCMRAMDLDVERFFTLNHGESRVIRKEPQ